MNLTDLPVHLGDANSEGINHALSAVVNDDASAKALAVLLVKNPRGVIRRSIRLNRYQNAALAEMTEQELSDLVKPLAVALKAPKADRLRVRFSEEITINSPMKIRCQITIET